MFLALEPSEERKIVLMGTYDLQKGKDRDIFRRLLNEINLVTLTDQL